MFYAPNIAFLTIYLYIINSNIIWVMMNYNQKCSKCGDLMKKIPIRKLDSTFMIEYYCDKCDESITLYPDLDKIKTKHVSFF